MNRPKPNKRTNKNCPQCDSKLIIKDGNFICKDCGLEPEFDLYRLALHAWPMNILAILVVSLSHIYAATCNTGLYIGISLFTLVALIVVSIRFYKFTRNPLTAKLTNSQRFNARVIINVTVLLMVGSIYFLQYKNPPINECTQIPLSETKVKNINSDLDKPLTMDELNRILQK